MSMKVLALMDMGMPTDLPGVLAMMQQIPRAYIMIALLVALVIGGAYGVYHLFFETYHYAPVAQGILYRDGLRTIREYNIALKKANTKTVISLLENKEYALPEISSEEDFLRRSKIKFYRIPVKLGGYPTTEDVRSFLKITEELKRQPVLFHCAQGIRRTGMMAAAYQMSVLGWDKEKAKNSILAFGHSERTIGDIKRFIDVYDPQTRTVTQDLGVGTE